MKKKEKLNGTVVGYCECVHVHLVGSSQCIIDGLKGIREYSRDKIKINLGKYCLEVVGSDLCINEFSSEGAVIEGDILSLEYCSD